MQMIYQDRRFHEIIHGVGTDKDESQDMAWSLLIFRKWGGDESQQRKMRRSLRWNENQRKAGSWK